MKQVSCSGQTKTDTLCLFLTTNVLLSCLTVFISHAIRVTHVVMVARVETNTPFVLHCVAIHELSLDMFWGTVSLSTSIVFKLVPTLVPLKHEILPCTLR
eukprot:TRINITY_DN26679_c0_g1_i7.p1 TRINITY_DN26679_c0_g1~~TRINITY_DN26679_c0_g1_i7.p1  ORF type:complete len:100 (-),score=2.50 TRINITY_DN26679_c0_g1_i7:21-320(-)